MDDTLISFLPLFSSSPTKRLGVDRATLTYSTFAMPLPMAVVHKSRLRLRKFEELPKVNALAAIIHPSSPTGATFREVRSSQMKLKEKDGNHMAKDRFDRTKGDRREVRFVRVNDRIFKVPEAFFLQMSPRMQTAIGFSSNLGGLTPERPIFLVHHSEDQFKQILSAHNAFPSLDPHNLTLDHLLTIGELSLLYGLKDLSAWFFSAFRDLVQGPHSPLRTIPNHTFIRMMRLSLRLKSPDLIGVIQAAWANRFHTGELSPIWALIFADKHCLRDLLGHACYGYLLRTHRLLEAGESINERGMLSPRQVLYIKSGYLSLRSYWRVVGCVPPDFEAGKDCIMHSRCVEVWKRRWASVLSRLPSTIPEVDPLNRLGFLIDGLKDDTVFSACLSPSCRISALKALSLQRDRLSHQLHHHFDV